MCIRDRPPLVPFLINVSIQTKPNGGYLVWASYESIVIVFDSDTQLFTELPNTGNPGDVIRLPGSDCSDELNNLWAVRISTPGSYSLDYQTQSGSWITPAQPPVPSITVSYTHLRAHETVLDIVCRLLLENKKLISPTNH